MRPGGRWGLVIAVAVLVVGYLISSAFGAGAMYYLTVEEYVERAPQLAGRFVRISGYVAPGTLDWRPEEPRLAFSLRPPAGGGAAVPVVYRGVRPDLLADGVEVIVEGHVQPDGSLQARQVLVKCPSKYEAASGAAR